MIRLACLVPVVLLAVATSAADVGADTLGLIVAGEPAKQPIVESTLDPWLKTRGYQVQLRVSDAKVADKLVDCFIITDQRCGETAVGKLKLASTLFVMVEVHHDTKANTDEVKLTGWLYGERGLSIASQSVYCRACKNDTLGPTVEDLAQALFAVAGEGTGRISIKTQPAGATVVIDGNPVGVTPWEQGLRTGPHTITVELPGHRPHTEQVAIKKDATHTVDTALAPIGAVVRPARKQWPLALAAGGAAAVAAGVVLIAIDQDCAGLGDCDVGTDAETYRDSATAGAIVTGVGVAAIAAGVVLYLRGGKPAAASATAWIDPGRGGGVGVVGRF